MCVSIAASPLSSFTSAGWCETTRKAAAVERRCAATGSVKLKPAPETNQSEYKMHNGEEGCVAVQCRSVCGVLNARRKRRSSMDTDAMFVHHDNTNAGGVGVSGGVGVYPCAVSHGY